MASDSDVLTTLQNGVQAINSLSRQLGNTFLTASVGSTGVGAGTITFSSSLASGFLTVTTSSGYQAKLALYPSS